MALADKAGAPLTRTDWLNAAIAALSDGGIAAVSIVQLAQSMGVTRGSFYHHFSDREDLLRAMLDYWETRWTTAIRDQVSAEQLSPTEELRHLAQTIRDKRASEYDAPFRAWALHDPLARTALQNVDAIRLDYIRGLFEAAGFTGLDAENRARLLLYYEMSDPAFFAASDDKLDAQLIDERLAFLLHKPG